jgi:phosphocarrier protein
MVSATATVQNEYGIHVRPSAVIAKEARDYPGQILVSVPAGAQADARNLLGLIGLGLTKGQTLTITVSGDDEEKTVARFVELFETRFDFQR